MFSKAFVALTLALTAFAQGDLKINTPASLIQCQPALLSWSGGTAPYFLAAIPGGQPSAAALKDFGQQSGTSLTWTVDIAAGTSVTLKITDSTGAVNYNDATTIQAGSTTTCSSGTTSSNSTSASGASGVAGASGSVSAAVSVASSGASSATSGAVSKAVTAASSASGAVSSIKASATSAVSSASSATGGASKAAIASASTTSSGAGFPVNRLDAKTGVAVVLLGVAGIFAL